jgi:hypothetical protein
MPAIVAGIPRFYFVNAWGKFGFGLLGFLFMFFYFFRRRISGEISDSVRPLLGSIKLSATTWLTIK